MEDKLEIYQEERPWGAFRQFTKNTPTTVKIITVNPDETLSLQSHEKRSEFWRVISGGGTFEIDEKKYTVEKGNEYQVPIKAKHRIQAGPNGIEVLEISTGDFDEHDITRHEDKYGRV
jgi:mannose-6-phosphate isomerase-like protein (cupin superfamily)